MSIRLFNRIVAGISEPGKSENYKYFTQRYDALGVAGFHLDKKSLVPSVS